MLEVSIAQHEYKYRNIFWKLQEITPKWKNWHCSTDPEVPDAQLYFQENKTQASDDNKTCFIQSTHTKKSPCKCEQFHLQMLKKSLLSAAYVHHSNLWRIIAAYRKTSSWAVAYSIGSSSSLKVIWIILYTLEILQTVPHTNPEAFRNLWWRI